VSGADGLPDTVEDELDREGRQHDAEQAGQNHVPGDTQQTVDHFGRPERDVAADRSDDDDRIKPAIFHRIALGLSRQQHERGDGAGPGNQGDGQRKGGDVGDMILGDRDLGRVLLVHHLAVEHHLEGDGEEEQAAADPERRCGDAEKPQERLAGQREEGHDAGGDHTGPQCNRVPLSLAHALGEGEKHRRQPGRIDHDEERDQRGRQVVDQGHDGISPNHHDGCRQASQSAR
jgi:hypothetical protein